MDLAADLGLDAVFVQSYEDRGWGRGHLLSDLDSAGRHLSSARLRAEQRGITFLLENPVRMQHETSAESADPFPLWSLDRTPLADRPRFPACEAPFIHGIIRADGSVTPCWRAESVGQLREGKFAEVWRSDRFRGFRRQLRRPNGPYPACCSGCMAKGWAYCHPWDQLEDHVTMGRNDFGQLGTGWHERDTHTEKTFRFTDSRAVLYLKNSGKRRLRLEMCVFSPIDSPDSKDVHVAVNGRPVASILVRTQWSVAELDLPTRLGSLLEVALTTITTVPSRLCTSLDFRRLGVAVSRIELLEHPSLR